MPGRAVACAAPLTLDLLRLLLATCGPSARGRCDRALQLFGFAGASRRSELVALWVEDVVEVPGGLRLRILRDNLKHANIAPRGLRLAMDLLLDLAERQRIDWGRLSILALAEQFVAAFEQLADRVPIERNADWLVMATRLVLLRSRLPFPESPTAAEAAARDAMAELRRIDDLTEVRAAVGWLGRRPVLGQTVFARGAPELLGEHLGTQHAVDVIAFLWANLSLFEDDAEPLDAMARYRPTWTDLYYVTQPRDRFLRILGEGGDGEDLGRFLPEAPVTPGADI